MKESIGKQSKAFILTRSAFTNDIGFRAGIELVRRGKYRIADRNRHWFWEWVLIEKIKK